MENTTDLVVKEETGEVVEAMENMSNVVPLEIKVKRDIEAVVNGKKKKFDSFKVKLVLPIYRDGKYVNDGIRSVNLGFGDNAFSVNNISELESTDDLATGTLFVKLEGLSPVYSYHESAVVGKDGNTYYNEVENPKTGKKCTLWVNDGIIHFEKRHAQASMFALNDFRANKAKEVEAEAEEAEELTEVEAATE